MISRMLGAPLGGTTLGGHQGFEVAAFSVITPPNFGGGDGSWLPGRVMVALGWPRTPVTTCAVAGATASTATTRNAETVATTPDFLDSRFMSNPPTLIGSRDSRIPQSET